MHMKNLFTASSFVFFQPVHIMLSILWNDANDVFLFNSSGSSILLSIILSIIWLCNVQNHLIAGLFSLHDLLFCSRGT